MLHGEVINHIVPTPNLNPAFYLNTKFNSNIRDTFIEKLANKLKESPCLTLTMKISGKIFIIILVSVINPIDHNREGDTKVASSFWLLASQIIVPIGFSFVYMPIWFDCSPRLRAFLSLSAFKPFSYLLYIMIPISGTFAIQWMYNLYDGVYVDNKMLHVYTIAFIFGMMLLSLFLAIIFILPISYPIKALYEKNRPEEPRDDLKNKKKQDEEEEVPLKNSSDKNEDFEERKE